MTEPRSEVIVELGARSYPILIGRGLMDQASSFAAATGGATGVIVCNSTLERLYARRLATALAGLHGAVHVILVPDGEAHKDWHMLQGILDGLFARRCDRATTLYALGGGVTGDVAGFAAACFMRGIAYVQVPTTLLAQVDSAVGGKTAINHPAGKNMIGAIHQPALVVADVSTLETLPRREMVAGLAEVIKYGAIADAGFLDWIDDHLDELLSGDPAALVEAVRVSCSIKAAVVAADEHETGEREILNFGHTFGHAIETALGHGTWLHGEAVGAGMAMAAELSRRLGLIEASDAARLIDLVGRAGLPVRGPGLEAGRYVELMRRDKKSRAGELRLIVLNRLGRAAVRSVDPDLVAKVVADLSGEPTIHVPGHT